MIKKYKKKPVIVEAIQWTGHNTKEVLDFIGRDKIIAYFNYFEIKTLEGNMRVNIKDWIIKGVEGEFYPCKPEIFEKTYEKLK